MSDKARQRLGEIGSLPDHIPLERHDDLRRFLSDAGAAPLAAVFSRRDGHPVPVRFSCLTRTGHRIFLAAEGWERATDNIGAVDEELLLLQGVVLEKYFRLLRLQQSLDSRLRRSRNPGLLLIEQLERERARLASDLHSSVGQSLSAISVHVDLIHREAPDLSGRLRGYLDRIAQSAREAGEQVRAVSRALYSLPWQNLTIEQALQKLWQDSGIPERFQASLAISPLSAEPLPAVKAFLYRTAQETIANAIRHSQGSSFSLALDAQNGHLRLRVEDDGQGFDPARSPAAAGIGLRSIRDQAQALCGEFHLSSGPGGTKLEVSVPLEPPNNG